MIEGSEISKRYGSRTILDGASMAVRAGECVVLTGDNGSGKTTLLHVLVGLRRPDAGRVCWQGDVLTDAGRGAWRKARERWAFMPQQVGLPPTATIRELLRFHAELRKRDVAIARDWLERVGLADAESSRVSELSGGMKQRLAIALSFFFDPDLIVMDEPASSLDPGWRAALAGWAVEHTLKGRAILVTSQLEESWGPTTIRLHCAEGRIFAASDLDGDAHRSGAERVGGESPG